MEEIHTQPQGLMGFKKGALVFIMIALAAYTYTTLKEAQYLSSTEATISVTGEGEVLARPDIATFSFSVRAEGEDAGMAQRKSAESINAILSYLEEAGIAEKDIKTQYYNLNPRYEYVRSVCSDTGFCPPSERVLRGYEVSQSVEVKVRDVDRAGDLISGVGDLGATNVSGLHFTIDDEEVLVAEAREAAIRDAKEKAQKLARDLDVRLVRITGFWEDGGRGDYPIAYTLESKAFGAEDAAFAPEIPTGENTFTSRVNISYEVR